MEKLFEAFWQDIDTPWVFYERYLQNGKTFISKIPLEPECYIESPNGEYSFILDKSVKLKKVLKKEAKKLGVKTYGSNNVGLEWIRRNYWTFEKSYYNMNPRVFALDIETTAFGPIDTKNCPEEIVSIQVFDFFTKVNYIFSLEDFDIANHTKDNKYFFDNRVYDFEVKFYKLESEELLLKAYFTLVKALNPLIVAAHNGEGFDFAYLFKRAKLYNLDGFSPFGKSKLQEEETKDGKLKYNIRAPGVFYMDSIALYKKFGEDTRTSASYSLDALASKVLGENKVEHDCFSSFDGFRTGTSYIVPDKEPPKESIFEYKLYQAYKENNNEKFVKISKEYFIHYSIIDTYLLFQLIDKMKIIDIMVGIAATMGTQLDQTLGIISTWSIYMRNYGLSRNLVMPEKDMNEEYQEFKGAFVKDPVKGKCGWTYSVDVTSMYPSQIMAFNISTDTYVNFKDIPKEIRDKALELGLSEDEEYHLNKYKENPEPYLEYSKLLEKYNLCGTLIGTCFRKDEIGILPDLVEKVFKARKADKEKMLEYERLLEETKDPKYAELVKAYDNLQLTKKILIVGVYGANGNPNFILFNPKISASITANSRFYVNLFSRNVDEFMMDKYEEKQPLLKYNDTDSLVGDSIVNINGKNIKIEDFYNSINTNEAVTGNKTFIKSLENLNYETPSVSKKLKLENKKVLYVMKHRVKKKFYKIIHKDKEVIVTEDHSIMVLRNNKLVSIKPANILKGDKLIVKQ